MELGRALRAGTPDGGAVLVPGHRGPAHRAGLRQMVGLRSLRPQILEDLHHLRDDLSRLLEHHRVPDADVLLINKILVVEGGVGDRGSRQTHRLHHHLWRQHSSTPHLDYNPSNPARFLFRRVLIGNCPAGTLGSTAYHCTV